MLLRNLLPIIIAAALSACNLKLPLDVKEKEASKPISFAKIFEAPTPEVKKIKKYPNADPRLAKILASPLLQASEQSIAASKKAVSVVDAQREPLISGNSNVGPRLSDEKSLDFEATAGVSVNKIVRDGGALDALTEAANLNVKTSQLIYMQNINSQLLQVLRAEQSILNFENVSKMYDEQLAIYEENIPLIDAAVKANVISKSEALKLEQLKIRSQEQFLIAKTAADAAQIIRKKFGLTGSDKFFKLDLESWKTAEKKLETTALPGLQLLDTRATLIEKDIAGIQATFDPKVLMAGSATANFIDKDNSIGFFGFNITLPFKDGGKRKYEIEEKNLQIAVVVQQKEEAKVVNLTAFKTLENFDVLYAGRVKLLDAQIENSEVIAADLELKLRAGAVSVADLATEKMNYYDLRNQKIALDYQRISEILKFYETIELGCELASLCSQVEEVAQVE